MYPRNPNNQTQNPGILPGKVVCFNWKVLDLLFFSFFFLAVLSPDEEQLHFDTFFEVGIIIWSLFLVPRFE